MTDVRGRERTDGSEVRSQKSEVRGRMSDVRRLDYRLGRRTRTDYRTDDERLLASEEITDCNFKAWQQGRGRTFTSLAVNIASRDCRVQRNSSIRPS